jgi:alpha-glucosidase (family GH31 glycosyl hydrolase)
MRHVANAFMLSCAASIMWHTAPCWAGLGQGVTGASTGAEQPRPEVIFRSADAWLRIVGLSDDILHVETSAVGQPQGPIWTSPMVSQHNFSGPTHWQPESDGVSTRNLRAFVSRANLCLLVLDQKRGRELVRICPKDLTQAWKTLEFQAEGITSIHGLGQYFDEPGRTDGDWIGRVWEPSWNGFGSELRGFAGGANNVSMFPVIYALGNEKHNFAVFVDNLYKQKWDFRNARYADQPSSVRWTASMWGDQLRWFVIAGDDLPALRSSYMTLTGKPPVPPKRAFGLWVSEFGYSNWDEVDRELAALRRADIPVEGFGLDLQWFGGRFGEPDTSRMGSLRWDEENFPNPREKIRSYREQHGVRLMLIEEPYISITLPEHAELARRNALVLDCEKCAPTFLNQNPWWGRGGMVDFTSPAAAGFWHDFRRHELARMGINDHWLDLGEPEQYNSWAWYHGFPELGKFSHGDVHNIYGSQWVASIPQGYSRNGLRERSFILSRTGTSGIQRHGAAMWSGDTGSDWVNLQSQMRVQTQMSLSGVDYYGSDVGGFQRQRQQIAGSIEELYTYWLANSAAFDVPLRPHSWNLDKQRSTSPALRGNLTSNRENIKQRYELAPWYYSMAHRAAETGEPLFPPAFFWHQTDAFLHQRYNHKMLGRDFFVASVTEPGTTTRNLHLPRGQWVNWHTRDWFNSNGQEWRDIPTWHGHVLRLPMFVRAGTIIPMQELPPGTMNISGKKASGAQSNLLRLRVVPHHNNSAFDLVEDDGETHDWKDGLRRVTTIHQQLASLGADGERAEIRIDAARGSWPGAPAARRLRVELLTNSAEATDAVLDGRTLPLCDSADSRVQVSGPCWKNTARNLVEIELGEHAVTEALHLQVSLARRAQRHTVTFSCGNGTTTPGISVYVTGSHPMLGAGDPSRAIKLDPTAYPTWTGTLSGFPAGEFTWRCIKRREGSNEVISTAPGHARFQTGSPDFVGVSRHNF